jgi:4'-phosphopantetheinyl transferase
MNSFIPISPSEIHLWLTSYDDIGDEGLHARYRELLNPAEKEQEPKFYFGRDRRRYLVTRALVRTVLSRYIAVDPVDWIFTTNAYGRPEIANAGASDSELTFNVSHTHSLIILGVARRRALGVDVENVRARNVSLGVADRFFAPVEVAELAATPADRQQERFFEYWTFKEAYIKARGMGLALPLDKFSFHYPTERAVDITIHPDLADDAKRWRFWQFRPGAQYLAAVCAEQIEGQDAVVTVRETVPMRSEKMLAPTFLRKSE